MKKIKIINGRIFDFNLLESEKNNKQFKYAIQGGLSLDEANSYNIKRLLVFLNPSVINNVNLSGIDSDFKKILKERYEIFENNKSNVCKDIISFYAFLDKSSLYAIIKYLLNLNENTFLLYQDNYLISTDILEIKNHKTCLLKELFKYDYNIYSLIYDKYHGKEELLRFLIDNDLLEDNLNDDIFNYKNNIIKFILETPKAYRYFNHQLLDKEMVKYLIENYKANKNYRNFCSDFRFYKKNYYSYNDVYNTISKYIPLVKSGSDYVGLCPFHNDHNPSLRVSTKKGLWKCFVCNIGGGASKFINLYENRTNYSSKSILYKKNMKNQFLYYLYANLPDNLKNDKDVIIMFLQKDGCLLKFVSKKYKYDEKLVQIAMENDITSFRYFKNDLTLREKYIKLYPILDYYLSKK